MESLTRCGMFLVLVVAGGLPACRRNEAPPATNVAIADPGLRSGRLENGLRYWIARHPNPPGKVWLRMNVAVGSAFEGRGEQGTAHFVEHMAFNGTRNFAPGEVQEYLASLGMKFGRDLNAGTDVATTNYRLIVPAASKDLQRGLLFFGDVARRMLLDAAEIEREREVLISEQRLRGRSLDRTGQRLFSLLAPESALAAPFEDTAEAIRAISGARLQAFYQRWYRPGAVTVLAVGDVDVQVFEKLIAAEFGDWRAPQADSAPAILEVPASREPRVSVVTVPGSQLFTVSLNWLQRVPGMTGDPDVQQDLGEKLALEWLRKRLDQRARDQVPSARIAVQTTRNFGHQLTRLIARCPEPEHWSRLVDLLAGEVKRAQAYPPTPHEWTEVVGRLRGVIERQGRLAPETSSQDVMKELVIDLEENVTPQTAVVESAQMARLLGGLQPQAGQAAIRRLLDPNRVALLFEAPASMTAPAPAALLATWQAAVVAPVTAPTDQPATSAVTLPAPPAARTTVTSQTSSARGVVSAELSNGVRLRLRSMDTPNDRVLVLVRVSRPGGEESPAGDLDEMLSGVLSRMAVGQMSADALRRHRESRGLQLASEVTANSLQWGVLSRAPALESGLQLLYHLLMSARIEEDTWREVQREVDRRVQQRQRSTVYQLDEATRKGLGMREAARAAVSLEQAQSVLQATLATGAVEVAIVGEANESKMLAQAVAAFGALPPRPAPRAGGPAPASALKGPLRSTVKVASPKSAVVRLGWQGPALDDVVAQRALRAASRVLTGRLQQELREKRGLTYNIEAKLTPVQGSRATWLGTTFEVAPDRANDALAVAREVFQQFAAKGPDQRELDAALASLKNDIEKAEASIEYWANLLLGLESRGVSLAEIERAPEANARLTAADLRKATSRYVTDRGRFELLTAGS